MLTKEDWKICIERPINYDEKFVFLKKKILSNFEGMDYYESIKLVTQIIDDLDLFYATVGNLRFKFFEHFENYKKDYLNNNTL